MRKGSREETRTTLFEQIGGMPACRRLSERFHGRIASDTALRAIFPKDLGPTTEHLALFLAERLGGPADYTSRRGKQSLQCRHAHLAIGSDEAERWLGHMFATMEELGIPGSAEPLLREYFRETASALSDPLLPFYHLPLDRLRALLQKNPTLATTCDHGRTLLRTAAREWDQPRVELLLEYGAAADGEDLLGHDPLYHAASTLAPGRQDEGAAVVALLIRHGADVEHRSGPGRLAALHATARRGSTLIAEALLSSGADIEARDARGETPLRRAVNCGQEEMVRLLLARGADPLSQDRQGRTPLDAARHERIRGTLDMAARRS